MTACPKKSFRRCATRAYLLMICLLAGLSERIVAKETEGASDWQSYNSQNTGNAFLYDRRSIVRQGDRIRVETRIRFGASLMGAYSYQQLLEIDCNHRTERALRRTFFSDSQWLSPAMAPQNDPQPAMSLDRNSPTSELADILCGV